MSLVLKCNNCKGIRTFSKGTKHRVGFTLWMLGDKTFKCTNCGHTEPPNFWKERFEGMPAKIGIIEASKLLGTTPNGSTLRRAIHSGRLKPLPYDNPKGGLTNRHLIARGELIRYYLREHGRNKKRSNHTVDNKPIGNNHNMK